MTSTDRKRILFISLCTEFGGAEVGLYNIIKNLDSEKYQAVLLVNGEGPLEQKVRSTDAEVVVVEFPVVMLRRLLLPWVLMKVIAASVRIRKHVLAKNISVIHCTDVLALIMLIPTCISRRIPVVYGATFYHEPERARLLGLFVPWMVQSISMISLGVKNEMLRNSRIPEERCTVVPWGVDGDVFFPFTRTERDYAREQIGIGEGVAVVGMIARLDLWKGHETFVKAAHLLAEKRSDLVFVFAGGSPTAGMNPAIEAYAMSVKRMIMENGLIKQSIILGNRDDVASLMNCLDVFVCPSDREGFGLVVPEALACGVPVVACSGVGALELLRGNDGITVVPPGDPGAMADGIKMVLDHAGQHGLSGREELLQLCSWRRVAAEQERIYEYL